MPALLRLRRDCGSPKFWRIRLWRRTSSSLSSGSDFAQSKSSLVSLSLLFPNSARDPHPCYQNWKFPSLSGVDSVLMYAGFCRRSRWRSLAGLPIYPEQALPPCLPASPAIQPPNFPFPSFLPSRPSSLSLSILCHTDCLGFRPGSRVKHQYLNAKQRLWEDT